ncbi:diguanylate cyclase [Altericroceibacterium spongiae]|uniref:Diguanylate cyclase n=1 Tax=Altericroceibacterium spongiae TaxID=2320269 RepID=A0A420ELZ7_9SPHN|nr:diguanylate cyclase [Altericroceibacterium spongiae]RKF21636.1 diguanylate cyclase [Altericroceibacterium spongiae]
MLDREKAEKHRQRTLAMLAILDTAPEREFEAIVSAARRIFRCKTSYISLIDVDRQWFKARQGFAPQEVPRECSICATAVDQARSIVVSDLQADPYFSALPDIRNAPELHFFVTLPLLGPELDGQRVPIGTLCVIDDKAQNPEPGQLRELGDLAHLVEVLFQTRFAERLAQNQIRDQATLSRKLERRQRQFELAEKMANIGSWRLDLVTQEVDWSHQTQVIHGISGAPHDNLGHALEYFPPKDRQSINQAVETCIATGESYDLEVDLIDAQGMKRRVRAMGMPERVDGKPVALIGVIQDVTERHIMLQKLHQRAFTDELTGLANRARLNQYLDDSIIGARKRGRRLAAAIIDLDRFKQANDRFGHEAGDDVLRFMADRLRHGTCSAHLSARLGGDEFVVVIEESDLLDDLPGTLHALLEELRYEVGSGDDRVIVTATIGAAWLTREIDNRSMLLRFADYALYTAKEKGRGTAAIFDGSHAPVWTGDPSDIRLVS